jgi:nitrogen fixation NifU-like protein
MYSQRVMEEFYNPKNFGVIKGASGVGKIVSDIGSEIIKIYIKVEKEVVTEATFQTFGGVVAIAATSIATNLMIGKTIAECEKINANSIIEITGSIPENKMYLVQAAASAVQASINSYRNKSAKDVD